MLKSYSNPFMSSIMYIVKQERVKSLVRSLLFLYRFEFLIFSRLYFCFRLVAVELIVLFLQSFWILVKPKV